MTYPFDGITTVQRKFLIGTSDWSNYVLKWPTIKPTINNFTGQKLTIDLSNVDKDFNDFYTYLYQIPQTCTLSFLEGTSEYTVFTGVVYDVKYKDTKCILSLRDRLGDFSRYKAILASGEPKTVDSLNPALITWQLGINYAGISDVAGSNNPDIDYDSYVAWAEVFSRDSITMDAYYDGTTINKAWADIFEQTASQAFLTAQGKIKFRSKIDVSSSDYLLDDDYIKDLELNLKMDSVITKQWVYGDYNPTSDGYGTNGYGIIVNHGDTANQNSYGIFENILKSENIWYTTSANATYQAQKRIAIWKDPVKEWTLETGLNGIEIEIGQRIRFIDSFYGITSADAWGITEKQINMETGIIKFELSSAVSLEPFILDVSYLDGFQVLI